MAIPNRRVGVLAFGKQSVLGTPLANPTYTVPKVSGGMKPANERDQLPETRPTAARPGSFKKTARGFGTIRILARPPSLGLLLYEAMGAEVYTPGTPSSHVFTMADDYPALPLTVWDLVGDRWIRFTDTYVAKMVISGAESDNIFVDLDLVSKTYTKLTVAPTFSIEAKTPRFKYIGSVAKLEADASTPTEITTVDSFTLTIDRAPEIKYGSKLTPQLIVPIRNIDFEAGFALDTAQQGWDFFDVAAFGDTSATTPSQNLGAGSFEVTCGVHPSSSNNSLKIASATGFANWEYDVDRPESDPAGGTLPVQAAGQVNDPDGTNSEIVITLLNAVASAYSA